MPDLLREGKSKRQYLWPIGKRECSSPVTTRTEEVYRKLSVLNQDSGLVTDLMVLANKTELNAFRSPKMRNI